MTNSSTVEGEHTIQGQIDEDDENEDDDEQTLAQVQEVDRDQTRRRGRSSPDVVETYSSKLRHDEDEIQLLRLKLEEVSILIKNSQPFNF